MILILALISISVGCAHMTPAQRDLWSDLVAKGEPVASYPNRALSGVLSILPGGGQFANGQVATGIVNVIFYPLSVLWGLPSAILDAGTLRKIRSVEAYLQKKAALERARNQ
jgi:TM2 domain-containing membrane protein YozV